MVYYFSETGLVNTDIWRLVCQDLIKLWSLHFPSLEMFLVSNNLSFHRDIDALSLLAKSLIYMNFLPPNTTHFTQPLDDLVFAIYKSELRRWAEKLLNALQAVGEKSTPLEIITAVQPMAVKVEQL